MSKTIWFNVFSSIFALLASMESQLREAISSFGINAGAIVIGIATINVLLRLITTQGISGGNNNV